MFRRSDAFELEHGGENVEGSHLGGDHRSCKTSSARCFRGGALREFDDERHARCRVVEENAVRLLAMFAETFAVVSDNDNSCRVVVTALLQER